MNIFYCDSDPYEAAKALPDKLVVKMPVESAQMLSTAHHVLGSAKPQMYKRTHENHPCSIWVRERAGNYMWLYKHFVSLCDEYTFRYGREHLSWQKLGRLLSALPSGINPSTRRTYPAQAMPEELRRSNAVDAYRGYLATKDYAKWERGRAAPTWQCQRKLNACLKD